MALLLNLGSKFLLKNLKNKQLKRQSDPEGLCHKSRQNGVSVPGNIVHELFFKIAPPALHISTTSRLYNNKVASETRFKNTNITLN